MSGYVLILGGAGFIGCNLADALLCEGAAVVVADRFSREGVDRNAQWLEQRHRRPGLRIVRADVRDAGRVAELVAGARQVFHLAAQVAVTDSLIDPRDDLETNLVGTFNVLEAARRVPEPPAVVFTSTNKVYGSLEGVRVERTEAGYRFADGRAGVDESAPLDFHSPYGCSKGAADQYVRDYARVFGLPTVVLRLSCIYGENQYGTEDQGWVAHFARTLIDRRHVNVYGDGYQVRDVLWIGDLIRVLRTAGDRARELAGAVFNIGGGAGNAVSVRDVIRRLGRLCGGDVPVVMHDWRPGDQRVYISDIGLARRTLGWEPTVPFDEGLDRLVRWMRGARSDTAEAAGPRPAPRRAWRSAVG